MKYFESIMKDIFTILYQYLGICVIISILVMLVWNQAEKSSWKDVWIRLKNLFQESIWKRRFFLLIYITFLLQKTIFNRSPWGNPLGNVIGAWGLTYKGEPNYELFENVLLFIPLIPLYKIGRLDDRVRFFRGKRIILLPLLLSLSIEIIQLFTRAGTLQLSDIIYNTVGGIIGGLGYLIVCVIIKLKSKEKQK